MTRSEYQTARRIVRANGVYGIRWISAKHRTIIRNVFFTKAKLDCLEMRMIEVCKYKTKAKTAIRLYPQ